ncbi:hypothetical protein K438DRAFT_1975138 [Mycena galopus ATCC 62051]|nr:hypothetical protein K438DRAFT_1975138 [Mycena galopus ATCC 62051]
MTSEPIKRRRHAEAQARYHEKNLGATREKARARMKRLRERRTAEQAQAAAEKRCEGDADYREYLRRRKFVEKFGEAEFLRVYFPLYAQLGKKHLPGQKFDWAA